MKTTEELNALKNELETLKKKLAELTDEELAQVSGGVDFPEVPYLKPAPPDPFVIKPAVPQTLISAG